MATMDIIKRELMEGNLRLNYMILVKRRICLDLFGCLEEQY